MKWVAPNFFRVDSLTVTFPAFLSCTADSQVCKYITQTKIRLKKCIAWFVEHFGYTDLIALSNRCCLLMNSPWQKQTWHETWASGSALEAHLSLSRMRTTSGLMVQSQISYEEKEIDSGEKFIIKLRKIKYRHAYFKKNFRPNSPASFFITFHDLTTRASCSSVKPPLPSQVFLAIGDDEWTDTN